MTSTASVSLQGIPTEVARSRRWIREQLTDHDPLPDELVDDIELVVSELVTNSVNAGSAAVLLSIELSDERLCLSVQDDAAGMPALGVPETTLGSGRGLPIVAALATDWGVRAHAPGKITWAAFTR